jgi:hypothetical protein
LWDARLPGGAPPVLRGRVIGRQRHIVMHPAVLGGVWGGHGGGVVSTDGA